MSEDMNREHVGRGRDVGNSEKEEESSQVVFNKSWESSVAVVVAAIVAGFLTIDFPLLAGITATVFFLCIAAVLIFTDFEVVKVS